MKPPDVILRCARAMMLALFCCLLLAQAASASLLLTLPGAVSFPDLTITKTHVGVFYPGQQNAAFTITVTNVGDGTYTGGIKVSDSLPLGLIYQGFSDPQNLLKCTNYPADRRVECGRSVSLPPGASVSFELYTTVLAGAPPSVTNVIDLIASTDPNPANNHAEDTAMVRSGQDLSIALTGPNRIREGQKSVSYVLTVSNHGSGPNSGLVTVAHTLPDGLIARSMAGAGWLCDFSALTCTRSDPLAVPLSYPSITLTVDVVEAAPIQVENRAVVMVDRDIDPANNTASLVSDVDQAADLTITVLHDGDFRQGQADALYRLRVTNIEAGSTISPVKVTDLLPTGLAAVSMEGSGWQCSLVEVSCTYYGVLAPLASTPEILLRVRVAEDAPSEVINYATVSGGGEFNTANNLAERRTKIVQVPDLTITKTHVGNFIQGQQGAQYTITVSNVGAGSTVGDVLVLEILPQDHPTWLEITDLSGLGWACDITLFYTCTREDDKGLPPGGSYPPITVTVNVSKDMYVLRLTNTAEVSGGGERNTTNNRAEDDTIILPNIDLAMKVSHGSTFTQGQRGAAYRLDVLVEGSYPVKTPVTVTNTLPPGLSATAISGEGWQCAVNTLTCTYASVLGYGVTAYPPITLTVDVSANAPLLVEHRARVTVAGDVDPSDDQVVCPTAIHPVPDLTMGIEHTGALVRGKTGSAFALTVTNQGGRTTAPVTVTSTLPDGLFATAIGGEGWSCDLATRSCTRADLLHSGFSYPPVVVEVGALSNLPAQVTYRAAVSGGGEANTANSAAALTVPVYTPPTVLQHPQDAPGCVGLPIAFRAKAQGVPAPEVQWQFSADGVSWTDLVGSTSDELGFTLLNIHTGIRFRAVFRSAAGEAVSQSAAVVLHQPLAFVLHPAGQSVDSGHQATFGVEVTGSPLQSLLWQISPDGAGWEAIPGASGKTLTLTPQPWMDGWQVRAAAINACGVFPSQPARLSVGAGNASKLLYLPMLSR